MFKEWLIRKLGGYTSWEMAEMEKVSDKKINKLEVRIKQLENPENKSIIPETITYCTPKICVLSASGTISQGDFDDTSLVNWTKEKIACQIGETLLSDGFIKFDEDLETWKTTTGSKIITGRVRVVKYDD